MRTSHLINNKSPILQHHERRQALHNSHLIRKVLLLAVKCVYLSLLIASKVNAINRFYASIPQFYPTGGSYSRLPTKQKFLPEGKPQLNMIHKITRALIVKKEHLDKFFVDHQMYGEPKTMEMRSSKTNIRERIQLIESGSGFIVGETTLYDCTEKLSIHKCRWLSSQHQVDEIELLEKWCFGWRIKETVKYENPIPYEHPKGAMIWVKVNN